MRDAPPDNNTALRSVSHFSLKLQKKSTRHARARVSSFRSNGTDAGQFKFRTLGERLVPELNWNITYIVLLQSSILDEKWIFFVRKFLLSVNRLKVNVCPTFVSSSNLFRNSAPKSLLIMADSTTPFEYISSQARVYVSINLFFLSASTSCWKWFFSFSNSPRR